MARTSSSSGSSNPSTITNNAVRKLGVRVLAKLSGRSLATPRRGGSTRSTKPVNAALINSDGGGFIKTTLTAHEISCDRETVSPATIGQLRGQSKVVDIRSVKAPQESGMYLINALEQCTIEYTHTHIHMTAQNREQYHVYVLTYTRYVRVQQMLSYSPQNLADFSRCPVAISRRKTTPAISDNISFSRRRCIDEIRDEVSRIQTKIRHPRASKTSSLRSLSPSLSLFSFLSLISTWSTVGKIAGLREKGVDIPEATTVGGISPTSWSKVKRNRDLTPPPDTLHGTRVTWNDFERRVSGSVLLPLDATRVTRKSSLHST